MRLEGEHHQPAVVVAAAAEGGDHARAPVEEARVGSSGEHPVADAVVAGGELELVVHARGDRRADRPERVEGAAVEEKYRERGLVVAGFPSNDFGAQEPGTEKVIKDFCELTYGVRFPMYEKTRVTKNYADPLYQALAKAANGEYPRWNFHKYLIDRNGRLAGSFQSHVRPDDSKLVTAIEKLL